MAAGKYDRPITFIVAVNDSGEMKHNLLESAVVENPVHQWLLVNNHENKHYHNVGQLYNDAARDAKHDLIFFLHQDVYLPSTWEAQLNTSLERLEVTDPDWGVVGAVGAIPAQDRIHRTLVGHWRDPHQYRRSRDLPQEVQSLDEMWLGLRRDQGLSFDPDLPGFHCYGVDICLSARARGLRCYALDTLVWHKHRNSNGNLIMSATDSRKIQNRETAQFRDEYMAATEYIRRKWKDFLPFHGTSHSWGVD